MLISVVMTVVASVFSGGIQTWSRGEDVAQQHQQLRFIRYQLGRDLRNAVPYPPIPMEGEKGRLRFVLAERPRKKEGLELVEIRYQVEQVSQEQKLVRTTASLLTGEEKEEVLLDTFSKIQFLYPYRGTEGEVIWKESWHSSPEGVDVPKWVKAEILQPEEDSPWVQVFSLPRGVLTEEVHEEKAP